MIAQSPVRGSTGIRSECRLAAPAHRSPLTPPRFRLAILTVCAAQLFVSAVNAQTVARAPHVTVSLIPERLDLAAGGTTRLAIRFDIEAGYHLYFAYPGQSGVGTKFAWQLPAGVTVDSIEWPVPERLVTEGLVTQVYQNSFVVLTAMHAGASIGGAHLAVKISWGVCRIQCTADDETLHLSVPAGTGRPNPEWQAAAAGLHRLAAPVPGLSVAVIRQGSSTILRLTPSAAVPKGAHLLTFFPLDGTALDTCVVAQPRMAGAATELPLGPVNAGARHLRGILSGWPAGNGPPGVPVDVPIGG